MSRRVISRVLVRAPLLPLAALEERPERALSGPLARAALELAAPGLGQSRERAQAARARANWARRAAFRATPHGLWAGVGVARLGARTRLDTGAPSARLTVAWGRLHALGRALVSAPGFRERARLRVAPSCLRAAESVSWLQLGDGAEARGLEAELDPQLAAVLEAASAWRTLDELERALGEHGEPDQLEEYLLGLLGDGLLQSDLEPPLVGPTPLAWMRARLAGELPALERLAAALERAEEPARAIAEGRALDAALPGAGPEPLHAVLTFAPKGEISRAAVERAARLAGLLRRLQEALAPPVAERALDPAVTEALGSIEEVLGSGALSLAPLCAGEYGVKLDEPASSVRLDEPASGVRLDEPAPIEPPAPPRALLAYLVDGLLTAARAGLEEIALDPATLDALLPEGAPASSYELQLVPTREPRGAPPGHGWLLGLHAPAGASWGRFAHALGAPLTEALAELAAVERELLPGEERCDVAYAPSAALGDLAAHPPVRARALTLTGRAERELLPVALALVPTPLQLRAGEQPVTPSPLHRLRSTTAPRGLWQLLAGFSLERQHAPWALELGPLRELEATPRVRLDGFVIAPRSFRLPAAGEEESLAAWRKRLDVPRFVQVGEEDELLLVDLAARGARDTLARLARAPGARAHEVWPPLDHGSIDRSGRRVELIAAVVEPPGSHAATLARARALGALAPPREAPPPEDVRTWKLFGAPERAGRVLAGAIAPAVAEALALAPGEPAAIAGWFVQRYLEPPGRRHHLRLRARAARPDGLDRFARVLAAALAPALAAGDLVSVETAPYFREQARFGAEALPAIESLWQAASELALALAGAISAEDESDAASPDESDAASPDASDAAIPDATEALVLAADALASGLGLELAARRALAQARRAAFPAPPADEAEALARELRARKPRLRAWLLEPPAPLRAYRAAAAALAPSLPAARWAALLPTLLHLDAVRLAGPDPGAEARAAYFWERVLDGLRHR